MLLYQASGLIIDYVTIIVASKCFSNITMDSLHESMVNVLLGVLSQTFSFSFSYDFASLCHSYIFGYAHGGRVAKICNIPDIYNCSIDLTFGGI